MATRTYYVSPFLTFLYPWVNSPDTKFNADGIFKVDGVGSGPAVDKFYEELEFKLKAAFEDLTKDMKPAEKKQWRMELPVKDEVDDEGNETGRRIFKFRQNAKIKLKDGTVKDVKIGLRDASDHEMHARVFGGSEGRIMYAIRPIKIATSKVISLRLDFGKVQVTKLADGQSGQGFGSVDGGYVEEMEEVPGEDDAPFNGGETASGAASGDY